MDERGNNRCHFSHTSCNILFFVLGDSGGALYVKETVNNMTRFVASGIVSYGYGHCAEKNTPR